MSVVTDFPLTAYFAYNNFDYFNLLKSQKYSQSDKLNPNIETHILKLSYLGKIGFNLF